MSNKLSIPLAIVAGGVIIAIAVYVSMPKKQSAEPGAINAALVRQIDSTDHILGNPAAKVMVVEYSDFDCAYCKVFDETMHQIIANEGSKGNVAWVYREFPLTEIHPNAMTNAEAAECAAQAAGNDAFWAFKTELFAHQPIDPTQYGTYAQTVGITGDTFATCYANASTTVYKRITADRQNALDMGAPGAPFSIILVTGKLPVVMNGGYSYDAVKALIDKASR
ncbi:MAG: thioredoxin domain-containing protein [Candidatus Paceibacterota bacterium]|jgi:protein-disulfide isomerase